MTAKQEEIALAPAISKVPLIGFDNLVTQIEGLMAKKTHVVMAISGFGGAGKSHLADKLRDHLNIKDSQTVRIDNLYLATFLYKD